MNKNRYNAIIKDYNKLNHLTSKGINDLIKKYPFSQSLYLCLARTKVEESPIEYEKQLSNIAVNVLDRATLYQIVNKPFKKSISTKSIDEKIKNKPITKTKKSITTNTKEVKVESKSIAQQQTARKKKIITRKNKKADFLSWLHTVNEKKNTKKLNPKTKQEKRDVIEYVHYQEEHIPNIPNDINKAKDFLESQIKAIKGKKKSIITQEEVFASESLAKIYLKQKLYKKAIEIYELLNLKFPKKSTYFASRIKEISKKI